MKVLFLSRWLPFPADNGSKLRISNLLQALAEKHDVTLVSFTESPIGAHLDPKNKEMCSEVHVVEWQAYNPKSVGATLALFSRTPRVLVDTYSQQMHHLVKSMLTSNAYDIVIASQIGMASYADIFQNLPAIFEEAELGLFLDRYRNAKSLRIKLKAGITWVKLSNYFSRLANKFNALTVVSMKEDQIVRTFLKKDQIIEILPNCIDINHYREFDGCVPQPNTLIFTGPFSYEANYQAITWFLEDVYHLVRSRLPDVNLTITGDHKNLPLPYSKNVTLTGYVDDIRPLISNSSANIVPLLQGGGTRLKIIESMALGTPVISTSKGAEGLEVTDGENILIADEPESFAEAVCAVTLNPGLRKKLSVNGRRLIVEKYSSEAMGRKFMSLLDRVVQQRDYH